MEYTTLSMKEIMLHAIAWMNLKDSRLSKINQSQKVYVWFYSMSQNQSC